ncbi:MAG: FecR domain-containing protein [Sphingobacteriales bacterium]|nr:FecR domain-containing protein [Sphingobacteriales bacterium]OJV98794.1 MAG: hypothetical protein BGO52_08460 [Sphingobacteriales bacterium 44-61]
MTNQPSTDIYALADALVRSIQGMGDENDQALIQEWLAADKDHERIYAALMEHKGSSDVLEKLKAVDTERALQRFHRRRVVEEKQRKWVRIAVAAAILAIAGLFIIPIVQPRKKVNGELAQQDVRSGDIAPASDKAVLVLAGGKKIALDERGDTAFAYGNLLISQQNGRLDLKERQADEIVQQQLITPNAGKYSVVLSDGTTVWLNAASKLIFPNRFSDRARVVELEGEGYFAVKKDAGRPFTVIVNGGSRVEVLGTVFNIKSYDSNKVRTTLLEGSVKVSKDGQSKLLRPGEMADVKAGSIRTGKGDIPAATAWRNDKFMFHNMPIEEVLEELGRWYDVQLHYAADYRQQQELYNGEISRSVTFDKLLAMLELTGVGRFKLQGRTLYITPMEKL